MLEFSMDNPFPLLESKSCYEEEKRHSEYVDRWLGFQFDRSESFLPPESVETWKNKGPQTFLTPYSELRRILFELSPNVGDRIVDLGAGYGRLGFVLSRHYPNCFFQGFEVVKERVEEANRVSALWKQPFQIEQADIADKDFCLPEAAIYFIYDFGHREQVQIVLEKLQKIANQKSIQFVGRGGRVRDLVQKKHPWLWDIHPAKHFSNFSIYRSADIS
jgi:hypothetical protein